MNYAFEFQGKGFLPDGSKPIASTNVSTHNAAIEQAEIEWLKTAPDKVMLYVTIASKRDPSRLGSRLTDGAMGRANGDDVYINTWLGTRVSTHEYIGRISH